MVIEGETTIRNHVTQSSEYFPPGYPLPVLIKNLKFYTMILWGNEFTFDVLLLKNVTETDAYNTQFYLSKNSNLFPHFYFKFN